MTKLSFRFLTFLWIAIFGLSLVDVGAQGCSDAGICSVGTMRSGSVDSSASSLISFSHSLGLGEQGGNITPIQSSLVEVDLKLSDRIRISLGIPYQITTGNLGTKSGFGDLNVSLTERFWTKEDRSLFFTIGAVLPSNNSDLKIEGRSLPMQYQSSLGTYDLTIGLGLYSGPWHVAIGYQHPFNANDNGFLHSNWIDNENAFDYFESNQFRRGDDVILRLEKRMDMQRSTIYVGILPIYRLQEDQIVKEGETIHLDGSRGLTLNVNFSWEKPIGDRWTFRFTHGNPVIWRKTRADGLTRPVVETVSFSYRL